jgi:hypothetical protein
VYTWVVDDVYTLSNNLYNGVTITSGGTYEIGGFTERNITVESFEQVVDLGVEISDPTKVVAKYRDTTDVFTYYGSDLSQHAKGFSTLDGTALVYAPGGSPFDGQVTYSNYVFQDASVTPTQWFFLTDASFAGSNTTGTLQITISEVA